MLCLFCASFVQPLCSLFSDIKTCAGFVPVLCPAQKRHKMSCAFSVLVLCPSVLILCLFFAWHRIGTNRNNQILCLVCAYFVRTLCVVCASLRHLFFTSVIIIFGCCCPLSVITTTTIIIIHDDNI
jgi:hypothetical protein